MTTEKQIEANRKNAQLSTGPKSQKGKALVSCNAIRHGVLTENVYVTDEMREDYARLKESFSSEFRPKNSIEYFLLDRIISCAWRLVLLTKVEAGMFEAGSSWDSPQVRQAFEGCSSGFMAVISRYEKAIENSLYRALEKLKQAQIVEIPVEAKERA